MKKTWSIGYIIVCSIYLFAGCSSNAAETYEGEPLKIAVAGSPPPNEFSEVEFVEIQIDDLFNNTGQYDALFVMEETFAQTSQDKYIPLYNSLPYATFFIGLNQPIEVFTAEGFSINDFEESKSTAFGQGYLKSEDDTRYWTFIPSSPDEDLRLQYIEILNAIDDFNSNNS